jgi:hypothetical protein
MRREIELYRPFCLQQGRSSDSTRASTLNPLKNLQMAFLPAREMAEFWNRAGANFQNCAGIAVGRLQRSLPHNPTEVQKSKCAQAGA